MNVRRVELLNFRSYARADVSLPDGATALVGPNGAGKSSLLVAIDVALFGAPTLEPFLRHGADRMEVTVHLDHEGKQYLIRRGWKGRSSLDFEEVLDVGRAPLTMETMSKTQARIEETLGLTRATFRASAYLAQGDAAAITHATPSERMEILRETIGGLDIYEAAHDRAKRLLHEAEGEEARLAGVSEMLKETVAELPTLRQESDALAERAIFAEEERDKAELAVRSAADRLQAGRERLGELRVLDVEYKAAVSALTALEQQRDDGLEAGAALDSENARLQLWETAASHEEVLLGHEETLAAEMLRYEQDERAYRAAQEERTNLKMQAEWHRLEAVKLRDAAILNEEAGPGENLCDKCGQTLGAEALAMFVGKQREAANDHMAHHHDKEQRATAVDVSEPPEEPPAEELAAVRAGLKDARAAHMQVGIIRERITQLGEKVAKIETPEFRRAVEEARVSTAAAQAAHEAAAAHGAPDVAALDRAAGNAIRVAQELRSDCEKIGRKRAVVQNQLDQLDFQSRRLRANEDARETLQREAAVLGFVVAAFAPTGIPLLVIENAVPMVEERAQGVLERLGGQTAGCRVELRTQRARKADSVLRDTLDIVIHTPEGDVVPYEHWSGGERMRLDLAIRIGLAQLLLAHGAHVELFSVDEPDGLDVQGRAALVDVIEEMSARYGFRKVILISHDDSLRDSLPQTIEVARSDAGSVVVAA